MKHFVVYMGLFLVFATSMGATRYLDSYTGQYVDCAQKWKSSVAAAEDKPALAERLLQMMDALEMTANLEACPALRADHDATLRSELESYLRQ